MQTAQLHALVHELTVRAYRSRRIFESASHTEAPHKQLRKLLGPKPRKNSGSHIDASHSRQPLVKGERLVRNEVNAVMPHGFPCVHSK